MSPGRSDGPRARLFVLGFLTLFLELVLIRYLAGNIWNLGYFPNLVLLAVFIGMGVGFLLHGSLGEGSSLTLFNASGAFLLLLAWFVLVLRPSMPGFSAVEGYFGGDTYSTYYSAGGSSGGLSLFILWLAGVALIFASISQRAAKIFRTLAPLDAYSWNIAGSCAGVLCFMLMSWWRLPAYAWFTVLVPCFWHAAGPESRSRRRALAASLVLCAATAAWGDRRLLAEPSFDGELRVSWSPYQKIEYIIAPGGIPTIYANGITHQFMLGREFLDGAGGRGVPYTLPYKRRAARRDVPAYKSVLVLGAGSGNDVAAALSEGVEHVDAVEIDPVIMALGREHHPLRPYSDPRVDVVVDDGRSFMTRTRRKYDLVVFALTDSLVKVSPVSQLRLENYLYTREAIARAHELLNEHGDLLAYSLYRRPWILQKMARLFAAATGTLPTAIYSSGNTIMLLGEKGSKASPAPPPGGSDLPEDDWPFLYLEHRGIPFTYAGAIVLLATAGLGAMLALRLRSRRRPELRSIPGGTMAAFLLMGLAFSLLETKSVIQFSLLFGTTWINNSLVLLAVLLLVLAANKSVSWARLLPPWGLFLLLAFSCLATTACPLSNLLAVDNAALRFLLASLMTFLPIYFANLMFSASFLGVEAAEHVLGWNLLGAMFGGMVEYLSLLTGYNALSLVVVACYSAAFLFLRADSRS
ncbi:MAG: hypothetical protein HY077_04140 [Elusimicrobia bacterium]|nr:hypothetical protein [Elusimicrobiota bacterium]